MNVDQAKTLILKAIQESKWVKRAPTNDHVIIDEKTFFEPEMLEALESLREEGLIVQVPSAGQAQTAIAFKAAEKPNKNQ